MCRSVLEDRNCGADLRRDAGLLSDCLDSALAHPWFRKTGPLARLPLDNPTLQRRDGYRDILRAWLLSQAAAALAWDRGGDAFAGPTRNAATLYEYWVFLQIHGILDEMEDIVPDGENPRPAADAEPFLEIREGRPHIHLKRGGKTCAPFLYGPDSGSGLRVHLYYERAFHPEAEAAGPGSYSRSFKPDYSLAVFPREFANEEEAARQGKAAYLHFDAKYRAENLAMLFGDGEADLDEEKAVAKTISTYKRGDLLKMHAYNDALRRTIGSYVLYPGNDRESRMGKFHEIVPGVGAFVLKPGRPECREALSSFLKDIFAHQADQFSQYRHCSDTLHATLRDGPAAGEGPGQRRPGATCILIHTAGEKGRLFRETRLSYCEVPAGDGPPFPFLLKLGSLEGAVFCGYTGLRTAEKTSLPWMAAVLSCEVHSHEGLCRILRDADWPSGELPRNAAAHLLFRLGPPVSATCRSLGGLTPEASFQAVSCTLRDLLACPGHPPARAVSPG